MSAIIMTVDDSRTIRGQVRRTLEQQTEENYSIVEMGDGLEALRWLSNCLRKDLPDVIVLDRNMPNMSGDECIRILKQDDDWNKLPFLFLTCETDIKQLVLCLSKLVKKACLLVPYTILPLPKHALL